ncbi:MAG: hypothetical protein HOJ54_06225, partial [Phycisphaerae bacterium]|nr:hypothetical protein [Phycisphaerae bacterium]
MRHICTSIVATLVLAGTSLAATINVPADYTTIQLAFDAASSGDEILVAPGTYTSSSYAVVEMTGKSVFLRSSGGPDVTTIDCQSSGPGIRLYTTSTSGTKIHGFTIRNGMTGTQGGAISSYAYNVEIEDCVFLNNQAAYGGGVSLSGGTVTNCEFKNNFARHPNGTFSWGGAMIVYGQGNITGCHFEGNEAIDGSLSEGGAV